MICPFCRANDLRVIDSRASEAGRAIRRRRVCAACGKRFTTYERVEQNSGLVVVKRGGSREPYDTRKVISGIGSACGKRPIPISQRRRIAEEVEETIARECDREVSSRFIGELVIQKLRELDEIAYIRFASEYLAFKDAHEMMEEIERLHEHPKDVKEQQALFEKEGS